jgi:hypothetical protein
MFSALSDEYSEFLDMFLRYLDGSMAPRGQQEDEDDERDRTPPPDVKDDPFRH